MTESNPQGPPSFPRPSSPNHGRGGPAASDVFARVQMVFALLLGIMLFAVPLYLWRRPRALTTKATPDAGAPDARDAAEPPPAVEVIPPPPYVKLADARVLECHDKGSKKTPAEQCDHIAAFEKAFADAIVASQQCVAPDAGAGSIEYVADLSFARKRNPVTVTLPHDGRSFQSPKIAKDCLAGVRARLATFQVGTLTHAHARYKVAVIASYAGVPPPP